MHAKFEYFSELSNLWITHPLSSICTFYLTNFICKRYTLSNLKHPYGVNKGTHMSCLAEKTTSEKTSIQQWRHISYYRMAITSSANWTHTRTHGLDVFKFLNVFRFTWFYDWLWSNNNCILLYYNLDWTSVYILRKIKITPKHLCSWCKQR